MNSESNFTCTINNLKHEHIAFPQIIFLHKLHPKASFDGLMGLPEVIPDKPSVFSPWPMKYKCLVFFKEMLSREMFWNNLN
jgi:hypothetical protein